MPLVREPVLREGLIWTADAFNEKIGENIAKVEAVYIHACVVIDIQGWPKECANCHWRSKSQLCDFYKSHGSEPLVIPQTNPAAPASSSRPQGPKFYTQGLNRHLQRMNNVITALSGAHDQALSAYNGNEAAWGNAGSVVDRGNRVRNTDIRDVRTALGAGNTQTARIRTAGEEVNRHGTDLVNAFAELETFLQQ
ncbi:unnamed protein product [Penicillium glandicola]